MYTIVYVGAKWCGTCKLIKPNVEKLARRYNVPITCLDYDYDLTDEEQMQYSRIPTVSVLNNTETIQKYDVAQVLSLEKWLSMNVKVSTTSDDDF